ncbi:MAG: hypothetical protein Q4D73_00575 [Actinomycetaceae bacterium]|nr:hypothetical protein [Actinomycetaceae bacterium]
MEEFDSKQVFESELVFDAELRFVAHLKFLALACEDKCPDASWISPKYQAIAAELGRLPELVVQHIEDNNYGSGYASFIEIRLAQRGVAPAERGNYEVTPYISVLVCKFAPLAALIGTAEYAIAKDGKSSSFALPAADRLCLKHTWDPQARVQEVLEGYGYQLLDPAIAGEQLPHGLTVSTILGEGGGYESDTIFDAWFHWLD